MNPYPSVSYPSYRGVSPAIQGPQLDKVNGIDSARAFPTKPNSMVAIFDANDDVFYIKTTDSNNFATLRRFRFYEEPEESIQQSSGYVTKEEFDKFKEEILNGEQSIRKNANNWKPKSGGPDSTDKRANGKDSK